MDQSDHQMAISILLVTFLGFFLSLTQAYTFYVGGRDGWVSNPKEDYNHWAERNRFLINDTLIFKYNKGYDTVLEVDKDDYYKCYKEKPLQALKDGDSVFNFQRSGPFFFISGHADNCAKGQRIIIVVLHPRTPPSPLNVSNSSSPSPSPAAHDAPTPSPVTAYSPPPEATVINSPAPVPTPSQDILHDFAPAPSPSCATNFGGSIIGSLMGLSFLVIVTFGYMI